MIRRLLLLTAAVAAGVTALAAPVFADGTEENARLVDSVLKSTEKTVQSGPWRQPREEGAERRET